MHRHRWVVIVLILAFLVSVGFNWWQAERYIKRSWWYQYLDVESREFSIGHSLLTDDTFFGDAKRAFVVIQVHFICTPKLISKHDLITPARVWDGVNIGRAKLENQRKNENYVKLSQDARYQIRMQSYRTDILPLVKEGTQSLCGITEEGVFGDLEDLILNVLHLNVGYAQLE